VVPSVVVMEMDSNLHFTNDPGWVRVGPFPDPGGGGSGRVSAGSPRHPPHFPGGVARSHPTLISPDTGPQSLAGGQHRVGPQWSALGPGSCRPDQGWRMTLPGILSVDFAMNASRASASAYTAPPFGRGWPVSTRPAHP